MNAGYLLIGGNMGDRLEQLSGAGKAIEQKCGQIVKVSAIYETAAWGLVAQPSFLNQALVLETKMDALSLLQTILDIEQSMGRIRQEKFGPRLIDIDILLFNGEIIEQPGLKVPHPQLQHRRFALQCLADIAGDVVHPVLQKTISRLLLECADSLEVHKFS